jgi:hypothetical protein
MRELVILSLNIIYTKDLLQFSERYCAKLEYLNFQVGPVTVSQQELLRRKHELNKRVKELLEDIMNSRTDGSKYLFNIELAHACLTRKQLERGYALFTNIYNVTFALNLRNGALLIIPNPESVDTQGGNLSSLEYTAYHEGSVYKFFDIDVADPLKGNLRY